MSDIIVIGQLVMRTPPQELARRLWLETTWCLLLAVLCEAVLRPWRSQPASFFACKALLSSAILVGDFRYKVFPKRTFSRVTFSGFSCVMTKRHYKDRVDQKDVHLGCLLKRTRIWQCSSYVWPLKKADFLRLAVKDNARGHRRQSSAFTTILASSLPIHYFYYSSDV